MATIILGAIGAAIGSAAGPDGAWRGFQIGAALGGLVDATNNGSVAAGRLSDLKASGSSYGVSIPRMWGNARLGGNIIWVATDSNGNSLVEHTSSSGGGKKGGPTVSQYTYRATFAVAFCAGTHAMPDNTLVERPVSLLRLWADDKLLYDSTATTNTAVITWYSGTASQAVDPTISAHEGANAPAFHGTAYAVLSDLDLSDFGNRIPNLSAELSTGTTTLGVLASDLCRLAGLATSDLDVSLAGVAVPGYAVDTGSSTQDQLDPLLQCYGFDAVEVDGVLRFLPRGGGAVAEITQGAMGASSQDNKPKTTVKTLSDRTDLPGRLDLVYNDPTRSYQQTTQTEIRQSANIHNSIKISTGLSLSADDARRMVGRLLDTAWVESESAELYLPMSFLKVAAGDPVLVDSNTGPLRARVTEVVLAPLGELRMKAVRDDVGVLTQDETGDAGSGTAPASTKQLKAEPTDFLVWSGAELADADQTAPGFYVAANGGENWAGGSIYYSVDGGTSYQFGAGISGRSTFGTSSGTLATFGSAGSWDNTNSVGVSLTYGSLTSSPDAQVQSGQNWAVLGSEVLGIGTATLTSSLHYTLSHLLRGLRSSSMTGHGSGELFVLVSKAIARVSVDSSLSGQTLLVKVVSKFQTLADVTAKSVTIQARTKLPVETDLAAHEATKASASVLGHIKVGSGLSIATDGTLSASGGSSGTVSSVGLSMPAQFSVSGSPVTSSGTLAVGWSSQSANLVLAGPNGGSAAAPTFRALAPADLPSNTVSQAGIVSQAPNSAAQFWRGDASWAALPSNTTSQAGIVSQAPNDNTKFWRGDASWATPTAVVPFPTWSNTTPYTTGQVVMCNDANYYRALGNNTGYDPTTDNGFFWELFKVSSSLTLNVSTAGGARFSDPQKAFNFAKNAVISPSATVTISVADGTYTMSASLTLSGPYLNRFVFVGNTTTPSNCILGFSGMNGVVVRGDTGAVSILASFNGFKLSGSGGAQRGFDFTGASGFIGANMVVTGFANGIWANAAAFVQFSGTVQSCTQGVSVNGMSSILLFSATVSSNTIGALLVQASRLYVNGAAFSGNTTDVSLDGSTGTLSAKSNTLGSKGSYVSN
ncbi:MAG: phage tail protein [Armatimonadetes bacterium]|nr:phage tail protein [Armatimonadota bacterium]